MFVNNANFRCRLSLNHRRGIKTEEKANVVASVFFGGGRSDLVAAPAVLHQEDLKNRMNCIRMI